jgi:hypothetical protein
MEEVMNFKTVDDEKKINRVLNFCYGFVPRIVKSILVGEGFTVSERGKGLGLVYEVKPAKSSLGAEFYFHNLFLEIATKDRDAELLEFDEKLVDFGYFLSKTLRMVESKLRPLLLVMSEDNIGEGIEKVMKLAPQYERLRAMWRDKDD